MIKFERINQPHLYGYTASIGDRTVEVLRSYPNDWFVYAHIAGKLCKARSDEKRPISYVDAMDEACAFLNRQVTFEVHS